ncbi:hypothetical protein CDAR_494771 [Caerostris darwini]|uniref:Uncharacterized protein n=1 Tax=Caerostris darwini TaxID=1538125 RepID=A0AAV4MKF5_9ARAC|nr:hypothetical protein CDAR_494771 [Caerostris darwini]
MSALFVAWSAPVQSESFHLARALQLKLQPSACIDERGGIIFGSVNSRARRAVTVNYSAQVLGGALNVGRCLREAPLICIPSPSDGLLRDCH